MSIEIIGRYAEQAVTFVQLRDAGRIGELIHLLSHQLADIDGRLRQRARHLRRAADRIDTAIQATDPADQRLNDLGEVQGFGMDTDRLIALRQLHLTWLRHLVPLLADQPTPAATATGRSPAPAGQAGGPATDAAPPSTGPTPT